MTERGEVKRKLDEPVLNSKKNITPALRVAPTSNEKAGSASYQIILCLLAFRNCVCSQIENSSRFVNQTQREISIDTSIHFIQDNLNILGNQYV